MYILDVYSREPPVDVYDDGYCNSCFRSSYSYHEKAEEQTFEFMREQVAVKGKYIDVHRVEYQLNRHQNGYQVTTRKKAEYADKEHYSR